MEVALKASIKKENLVFFIFYFVLIAVFLNRVIRGVDLTDESFYATLAYRLCKGNMLFRDMWEQCSTSALLPALILAFYIKVRGSAEGIVLLFRLAYFVCNLFLLFVSYSALKIYVEKKYAVLIASIFLFYAPFHFYTFSYNNQADFFLLLMCCLLLMAQHYRKNQFYVVAGVVCAYMVFCYPTLIFMAPIMCILLFIVKHRENKSWIFFTLGGLGCAVIILTTLVLLVGVDGIQTGISGILSDPAYGDISVWEKFVNTFNGLFMIMDPDGGPIIKIYILFLIYAAYLKKKHPAIKLICAVYPIIIFLEICPLSSLATCTTGTYAFYLSALAPFLWFFLEEKRKEYAKFLFYMWVPNLLSYTVIGTSSYGGALQAVQVFIMGGMVTAIGLLYLIQETLGQCQFVLKNLSIERQVHTLSFIVLALILVFEITSYYGVVYRDSDIPELTSRVAYGPYKGIYTTAEKKEYVENMTDIMQGLQDQDEKAMVLYHSNFAYLMLDSTPTTPTTWGIYPSISNESVFLKYFTESYDHIPDAIYIVDVPTEFNLDFQSREEYTFCDGLQTIMTECYEQTDIVDLSGGGVVEKYSLRSDKTSLINLVEQMSVTAIFDMGFYGWEENDEKIKFNWCQKEGTLNIENPTSENYDLVLKFTAVIPSGEKKKLSITIGDELYEYDVDTYGLEIELPMHIVPGNNLVTMSTDAEQFQGTDDPRELYFTIIDFRMIFNK